MVIGAYEIPLCHPFLVLCGMLPAFLLSSQFHFYYILLLTMTSTIRKSSTKLDGDRCVWKTPLSPFFVPGSILPVFILSSQFHFYCISLLTVTNIIEKTSAELNGDRWIWKTPLSPIFGAMWHPTRTLIELTVSLLLYFIIDSDQYHKKKLHRITCWMVDIKEDI